MNEKRFGYGDKVVVFAYTNIPTGKCCKQFIPIGTECTIMGYVGYYNGQHQYKLDKEKGALTYRQNELKPAIHAVRTHLPIK